jgi:hypothetical protein
MLQDTIIKVVNSSIFSWIINTFSIPPESVLIWGSYNFWLVALSIFIAILASFMGLQVASQATLTESESRRRTMLLIGSIALGGGIWTMHFIGMLAFDLCTTVTYSWGLTLLSLLPGIAASWVALNYISHHQEGFLPLLLGGVLVGAGIGTMHYTGMAAMEMAPLLRYDLSIFILSIVVAITLAMLSLWVRFGLARLWDKDGSKWWASLLASVVMGCAITGMHYTGMAAARFVRPEGLELSKQTSQVSIYLALGVAGATILIIFLVLGLNLIYRYKDTSKNAQENESRLRAMMDTAVDGIVTIDSKGIIIAANKAVERLLGWSSDELIGTNVKILTPEPHRSKHDSYLERYLTTGEARIIGQGREVEAVHKNGERIAIRLAIGHVKMKRDDFFVAFITDIRQRLNMEHALRENEEKFRSLITNIPGVAYRCGDESHEPVIFISDAVEGITGYPARDFIEPNTKRSFFDLVHDEDRTLFAQARATNGLFSLEYRIVRRDGETRWVLDQGIMVNDEHSDEVWLDGFIMDITERRSMEQALREAKEKAEQAAAARAAFLANMSHEIRTPMNAIIGFSDILLESTMTTDQNRQLKTINQNAKSLLHLLNDVLDSAKLDKGKLELEIRIFSLIEEVDAVISTFWLEAHRKGLNLIAEISPKLEPNYSGSPERIRQVLTNLLSNAIKFTQTGFVKVTVNPIGKAEVEFVIKDSGIGMSQEQMHKVFDPFTQADASMSRRFGGTGLGTSISKQLVELMQGRIEAESEYGKGSTFRFVLPLTPVRKEAQQTIKKQIELPPMTILIVDDIQQNIELLTILLERHGHKVLTARDGKQALIRMSSEQHLDLVLMDVQMPVMDGLTAAKERRRQEKAEALKHIPIVALTASVLEDDRTAASAAGMDGFANKPVDFSILSQEIARVKGINIEQADTRQELANNGKLIDETRGIAIWGSQSAYYQQLNNFIEQRANDFSKLSSFTDTINSDNIEKLKTQVHTLKGVCGNLSLISLMRHFEKLEVVLQSHPEQSSKIIERIQVLFSQVQSKAATQLLKEDHTKHESPNTDLLPELLKDLKLATQQNEIEETLLETLLSFANSTNNLKLKAVYQYINDFDFSQAGELIDQLLDNLSSG